MTLIQTAPPTKEETTTRNLGLVSSLTEAQKEFIKNKFMVKEFYQSTTLHLYMPTFVSMESKDIKKEADKLVKMGLAHFNKSSGYTIYNDELMKSLDLNICYKVLQRGGNLIIEPSKDFSAKPFGFVATYSDRKTAEQHVTNGKSPF